MEKNKIGKFLDSFYPIGFEGHEGERPGRILPFRRTAVGPQTKQPEELTGLAKWEYEEKMGIPHAHYYHKRASMRKKPEGHFQRSRARLTEKEAYFRQLIEYQQKAIEDGSTTWDETPDETRKLMEERLMPETIANLKAAKNPVMDEDLKIVADDLLYRNGHTFDVASQSSREESFASMKLKRIDNMEEKMEMTTETEPGKTPCFEFDAGIQRKIVAMIILDKNIWPEAKEIVRPEFFENPVHAGLVRLAHKFYDEYQHPLTVDEFCQECFEVLAREMKPEAAVTYLEELEKVIQAGDGADFSYVRDKLHVWARSQAVQKALLKSADLCKKGDFDTIGRMVAEALAVGNGKDGGGFDDIVADDVQEQPIEWLWPHILPKAALSVIIGMPTSGKSWFSMMVAARVSAGRPFPNHEQSEVEQGRVLILQSEDNWSTTCKRRLRLEGADMSQVYFVKGVKHKDEIRTVDLSTDLEKLRQRMQELGNVKLIIVDPLDAYVGLTKHVDTNKGREVRLALRPLEIFIEQEKVAVVGIMHLNKSQMSAVIHRISGSAAWGQVPRAIWAIVPKRDTPDVRQFLSVKSNTVCDVDRRQAEFCFRISDEQHRIELAPDEEPGDVSGELGPATREDAKDRRTKIAFAIDVLESVKDAPDKGISASVIMNECPEISKDTWAAARQRLGWTTQQTPDGWMWHPPRPQE